MLTKNALNVKKYIKLTKEEFDSSGYPFGYKNSGSVVELYTRIN
jgi:hypothetical protein